MFPFYVENRRSFERNGYAKFAVTMEKIMLVLCNEIWL